MSFLVPFFPSDYRLAELAYYAITPALLPAQDPVYRPSRIVPWVVLPVAPKRPRGPHQQVSVYQSRREAMSSQKPIYFRKPQFDAKAHH